MLKLLFKKQIRIELLIEDYLGALEQTQNNFREAMNSCIDDSVCHKFESKADDIRDEIKAMMYGNTLILDSRGDNQRHIVFIGLSFDKFWVPQHMVYKAFPAL